MTFANRSLQAMGDFAIQFNKNSFGIIPAGKWLVSLASHAAVGLSVPTLSPNSTFDASLQCSSRMFHSECRSHELEGAVQKMDPLGKLQVAVKNNLDVHYFSCLIPYHVIFSEEGALGMLR